MADFTVKTHYLRLENGGIDMRPAAALLGCGRVLTLKVYALLKFG